MLLQEAEKFSSLDLLARQVVEGFITGMHKSPFHGFSVEFAEHRTYNPGESTKNMDWRLFARTDKLFVKRYEEETNLRCRLIIDQSASMYYPEKTNAKIKFSIYASAIIANLLKRQRDAFGLTVFDEAIPYQSETKSSVAHYRNILAKLEETLLKTGGNKTNIATNLHLLAEQFHRRSLVVLFTDMFENGESFDAIFDALQHLKFKKHDIIIFHVTDHQTENAFEFSNKPTRFVDLETGESVKLMPDEIKESYLSKVQNLKKELQFKCNQYKIELVEADVRKDFNQVLLPFLLKRQSLH